jgi:hypothetical protein
MEPPRAQDLDDIAHSRMPCPVFQEPLPVAVAYAQSHLPSFVIPR